MSAIALNPIFHISHSPYTVNVLIFAVAKFLVFFTSGSLYILLTDISHSFYILLNHISHSLYILLSHIGHSSYNLLTHVNHSIYTVNVLIFVVAYFCRIMLRENIRRYQFSRIQKMMNLICFKNHFSRYFFHTIMFPRKKQKLVHRGNLYFYSALLTHISHCPFTILTHIGHGFSILIS